MCLSADVSKLRMPHAFIQSVEDKDLERKIFNLTASKIFKSDVQAENANMQLMQLIEGRNALN